MTQHKALTRTAPVLKAMSYGPFCYARAVLIGFIVGCIAFLAWDASIEHRDVVRELPVLLLLSGTIASAVLLLAMTANYRIGRQIWCELELQRRIFAGGELPPPMPRPDVPGIEILPARGGRFATFADRSNRPSGRIPAQGSM